MPDFPELPIIQPPQKPTGDRDKPAFPELPIVIPDPPRLTLQEKYGSFFYLGTAGLVITIALVAQFIQGIWTTRDFWFAVYAVNDPKRTDAERASSAWIIARSTSGNDRQKFDLALRKDLPDLTRYIIAEGLTSDAIRADTKAYALMVAKSEDWPAWLRLLIARPMAYGAGEGYRIAWEPLDLLRESPDPALALLATYTRSVMPPGDTLARKSLLESATRPGPFQGLAALLEAATKLEGEPQVAKLDEATRWIRTHHPEARKIWNGWEERDGKVVPVQATKVDEVKK